MEMLDEVKDFLIQNASPLIVIVTVVAVGAITSWQPVQVYIRGLKMKRQRRTEVQTILADAFTEIIMDKVALGQINLEEAREEGYLRLKRAYPECKDLHPSETLLKERIEKRLNNGTHSPVALPTGERKLMFARRK